jgi:four helix bundle protein
MRARVVRGMRGEITLRSALFKVQSSKFKGSDPTAQTASEGHTLFTLRSPSCNRGPVQDHRRLRVWNEAMRIAEDVYRTTDNFPPSERYGLALQMRRAAVSVPSNLAEGCGRGAGELVYFASIALGSCNELETQAQLARNLDLSIPESLIDRIGGLKAMLYRFIAALGRRSAGTSL